MRVHTRLAIALSDGGWHRLDPHNGNAWYRWQRDEAGVQHRQELHLVYHGKRLAAWSVWNNYRIDLDQGTGRTGRLLKFAATREEA